MKARISIDLGDPRWIRLLKNEAQESDSTVKEVLVKVLEAYFSRRLETKHLLKVSHAIFNEWRSSKDSDYDHL